MLPPLPTAVLEANPNFANLYNHLITNILESDGSTSSTTKSHEQVTRKLNEARKTVARDAMLLRALEEIAMMNDEPAHEAGNGVSDPTHQHDKPNSLPTELRSLILNIISYLSLSLDPETSFTLPPDTNDLMAADLETFHTHLPQISQRLSTYLTNTESQLALLTSSLSPQPIQTTQKSLPVRPQQTPNPRSTTATILHTALQNLKPSDTTSTLSEFLTHTTNPLTSLLTHHTKTLHSKIRTLELQTHGIQSRHLLSRSTHLATLSRGIALKTTLRRLEAEKALYGNEDLLDSLNTEYRQLVSEERRLRDREEVLRGVVRGYESAGVVAGARTEGGGGVVGRGEDVFRVLGERYAEVEAEIERVRGDVEGLEGRWVRTRGG